MTTELVLFIIVGALAVAAAIMMLLSNNAVHSALFLVVTMACLAFLFLLLNAPFLAMIQITVYAGAVMVLFLFVIMLLGSEKLDIGEPGAAQGRQYRWYMPVALGLVLALLLAAGLTVIHGRVNLVEVAQSQPLVRVVNADSSNQPVSLYANGSPLAESLAFGESTTFSSMPMGDYVLSTDASATEGMTVSLSDATAQTIIVYGDEGAQAIAIVGDNLNALENERTGRLTLFNAFEGAESVALADLGSSFVDDDTFVLLEPVTLGNASGPIIVPEQTMEVSVVDGADDSRVFYNLHGFELARNSVNLLVVTSQTLVDETVSPFVLPLTIAADHPFGSPYAIGELLFTNYMLPFQLMAVLLLAAMVGAIVLTHHEVDKSRRKDTGRRKVSRPLTNVIASQVGHEVVVESATGAEGTTSAESLPPTTDVAGD